MQLSDCLGAVGGGILRGLGKQKIGATYSFCGYYGIALPLGIALTFSAHMGIKGLWLALASTSALVATGVLYTISTTNWETETREIRRSMLQAQVEANRTVTVNSIEEGNGYGTITH
jgi:MATE family multidrug resistance protein